MRMRFYMVFWSYPHGLGSGTRKPEHIHEEPRPCVIKIRPPFPVLQALIFDSLISLESFPRLKPEGYDSKWCRKI